jgi:fatty-acyl-CoA synthase
MRLGAIYVPLNWRLSRREIAELLQDCSASAVYFTTEFSGLLDGLLALPRICIDDLTFLSRSAALGGHDIREPVPDQVATLLYTSGTTGRPKGVIQTVGSLRAASDSFRWAADVRPESALLCDSPMFHQIGLVAICHTAVMTGATLYLSPSFSAAATLERIASRQLRITHYFTVPQVVQTLLGESGFRADKMSALRALFVGGAPTPQGVAAACRKLGIKLINGYGSSEAGTIMQMPLDDDWALENKVGSVGKPVPAITVSVRDARGEVMPRGQIGEIWVRGASVTTGYWGSPETNSFIDGWFRTGDAAYQDVDGFYFLVDRWKDMYISGGENVFPAEVEQMLMRLPGVAEVAVVGQSDEKWGEVGEAYIVQASGASLTEPQVLAFAREQIAAFKMPKKVHFVDALPRTGSGKIRKSQLRRAESK